MLKYLSFLCGGIGGILHLLHHEGVQESESQTGTRLVSPSWKNIFGALTQVPKHTFEGYNDYSNHPKCCI